MLELLKMLPFCLYLKPAAEIETHKRLSQNKMPFKRKKPFIKIRQLGHILDEKKIPIILYSFTFYKTTKF